MGGDRNLVLRLLCFLLFKRRNWPRGGTFPDPCSSGFRCEDFRPITNHFSLIAVNAATLLCPFESF